LHLRSERRSIKVSRRKGPKPSYGSAKGSVNTIKTEKSARAVIKQEEEAMIYKLVEKQEI